MTTAIPGYKMGLVLTPFNAAGGLVNGQAVTVQVEDQNPSDEVEMDEVVNALSNGFYEGIPVLSKAGFEFTAVLSGTLAEDMIRQNQQNKLFMQAALQFSKGDANPWTYVARGIVVEFRKMGQVKKGWRCRGRMTINGGWVQAGAATGGVST